MKKILLSIICIIATVLANAQTPGFQWAKDMGGAAGSIGGSIAIDALGNVYTTGSFLGTVDFDPGAGTYNLTSTGYVDIFISKLDAFGNFVWAKDIGGIETTSASAGTSITTDASGKVYVTGNFSGTADFDPGVGVFTLLSGDGGSSDDIFVLKLDSSGNFIWAKQIGGTYPSSNSGNSIAVDTSGNVYTTGFFQNTVDFDPGVGVDTLVGTSDPGESAFISKLDASGNFVWAKQIEGSEDSYGNSIKVDLLGNVYTTGTYDYTGDFDPGVGIFDLTSAGAFYNSNTFILKLDDLGNFVWAKSMGGTLDCYSFSLALDTSSNIYTTGYFKGTADFDPGAGTFNLTSNGGEDIFISKLNSSGNFVWAKNIGGTLDESGKSVGVDALGNIYTIGEFSDTIDFDPGAGIFNLIADTSSYNTFISKLDPSGNFVWAKAINGIGGVSGASIVLDTAKNIYITGQFNGTADFDPSISTFNLTSTSTDIFVLKIGKVSVWPGDADHNNVADNNDLLPIGLYYGQTGTPRATISNTWMAYNSTDWGMLESSGADIKHADCNGDGIIDANDTLAVNLNFSLTHAITPIHSHDRLSAPELHFVTSSSSYTSGSIVDVEVWAGTSAMPVSNLYGIAFNINYDASLVQPSTESLTYPVNWLGTPGTNEIKISKIDALATTAYGAETRINHTNASGFGKIADFKFQLKSSIPANTIMPFSFSGYKANDATGTAVLFNSQPDTITINSTAGIKELNNGAGISIFPNPTNGVFNVIVSSQTKNSSIEVYNSIGVLVYNQKIINEQNIIELTNEANGLYFIKVMSDGKIVGTRKIVKE